MEIKEVKIKVDINHLKAAIEAILFAAGRPVEKKELILALEVNENDLDTIISNMQEEYKKEDRGIELIKVNESYQLATKTSMYEYIYPVLDKRTKPNLSSAALETLAIIAYNPQITRAEIESIRGVGADACVYKLLEYGLIKEAGKIDLPGKPMSYKTTDEFLKMFGYSSLEDLPELPRYKLDENHQIVVDEILEENQKSEQDELSDNKQETSEQKLGDNKDEGKTEAPMPERVQEQKE